MGLWAPWIEQCDGNKMSSCKNYNQSLNTLVLNDLRTALLISEFSAFFGRDGLRVRELHDILALLTTVLLVCPRWGVQRGHWRGFVYLRIERTGAGAQDLDSIFLAGIGNPYTRWSSPFGDNAWDASAISVSRYLGNVAIGEPGEDSGSEGGHCEV